MTTQKWILLAEDNPQDADLAMRALAANGVHEHVVVARDGLEALDCLNHRGNFKSVSTENPAVVLLDLKMPKVDGLAVLHEIKTTERFRNIPVVVFTSSREEIDIARSYQLGANAYVVKPVDFQKFRDAVKEVRTFWLNFNEPPPVLTSQPSATAA
ncbi:MAG TPA: response regulator [Desulfuromonadaceae bacterium]|nr:response regulator [Desulfuromonadaceae bacterium]